MKFYKEYDMPICDIETWKEIYPHESPAELPPIPTWRIIDYGIQEIMFRDKIFCTREDIKDLEDEYMKIESGDMVPIHPDPVVADILDRLERMESTIYGKREEKRCE